MLLTRSKKSSNKREPSPFQEETAKAAEFANLVQVRPRQSKVHKAADSQKSSNGGRRKISYQSPLILKEPVASLTEQHKELQFSDNNNGSGLSRRNIESNEPEENTRVKINGSKMSSNDIRVELGEPTKTSGTLKGLLGNSELQIGGNVKRNSSGK